MLNRPELSLNTAEPLVHDYYTTVNLVTTVPFLADKLNECRGCQSIVNFLVGALQLFPSRSLHRVSQR